MAQSDISEIPDDIPDDDEMISEEQGGQNSTAARAKGGLRATFFIYGMVTLENMSFVASSMILTVYFWKKMHFSGALAANMFTNFMGATYAFSLVGAFVSDVYLTRYLTALIFGSFEVLGLLMMAVQAHTKSLLPKDCGKPSCLEGGAAIFFYAALYLFGLGAGGVKGCLTALGADQFNSKDPKEAKGLASYFNWLALSSVVGSTVGVTVVVWVATNSWWKGFLVMTVATTVGYIILCSGKPYYRLHVPNDSPLVRITQVVTVAIKNRGLALPGNSSELYEVDEDEAEKIPHTQQLRWLDRAAILSQNVEPAPWKVCTVTQVEEVKVLARMIPIIGSTIIFYTCMAQFQTFSMQQGTVMNQFIGSFKVPSASIPTIPLVFMIAFIPIYDRLFVPFIRKFTRRQSGITQLQRVGVGLVLSSVSMAVAALVEFKRRDLALKNPEKKISIFWLGFQFGVFGMADMFTLVGLNEFYYREAPAGMRSLTSSFTYISQTAGYFSSSIIVAGTNSVTKRISPSRRGWLEGSSFNRNNLDLFYLFLAIVSALNFFFNYLFWTIRYTYKTDQSLMEPEPTGVEGDEEEDRAIDVVIH